MKRYIKSSLCKYTKKECIDAIQWMFGYNKAEANQYYATANKELLESVVDVFKSNAEKSFIYDSTNIEGSSYDIGSQDITASTHSASDLAKFIEDSVNTLLTTDYTNCRYELDDTWAVYVGWSDAGFDEDDDSVIHDEDSPDWVIGVKIADMEDAMWTDFDWCNMPYDKDTGDVWDTQEYISHDENYSQLASWLLENYEKIVEEYGETEDDDYYIDDDDEDYE